MYKQNVIPRYRGFNLLGMFLSENSPSNNGRSPGYCVNDDEPIAEPFDLWDDSEALEAAAFQWRAMAERYKDIDNNRLSFNIVNEPKWYLPEYKVTRVTSRLIDEIRKISPERTIVVDGIHNGSQVPLGLLHLGIDNCIYSCRGYQPGSLTHFFCFLGKRKFHRAAKMAGCCADFRQQKNCLGQKKA